MAIVKAKGKKKDTRKTGNPKKNVTEKNLKTIVAFYSRTGTTRRVAEKLAGILGADLEEIIDCKARDGAIGYIFAGKDATMKNRTEIKTSVREIDGHSLVVIGTPVWASTIPPAIREYAERNAGKFGRIAFFCTASGGENKKAFSELEKIIGKPPEAILELSSKEALDDEAEKTGKFAERLKKQG